MATGVHHHGVSGAEFSLTEPIPLQAYKGIGMLKLGRMHRQTGKKIVDPTAMSRLMREVSHF